MDAKIKNMNGKTSKTSIKTDSRLESKIPGFQREGKVASHFYLQVQNKILFS